MFENNVARIDNGNNTKRDVGLDIIFYYNDDDDDDYHVSRKIARKKLLIVDPLMIYYPWRRIMIWTWDSTYYLTICCIDGLYYRSKVNMIYGTKMKDLDKVTLNVQKLY